MTAATLTHLPLAAGGAVLASTGRAAVWMLSRYMRAPLANTAILAMVSMSAIAASNALYFQHQAHPAPLFAPQAKRVAEIVAPRVLPVTPAVRTKRPQVIAPLQTTETTGSVARDPQAVIGNAEVFELQRKLQMMELFEGEVDGYYGPKTAGAIRKFEARMGMTPKGELNQDIIGAVRAAPAFATTPRANPLQAPAAKVAPLSEVTTTQPAAERQPAAAEPPAITPLPAPAPLPLAVLPPAATVQPAATEPARPVRELPETPQEAFNIAVDTAGDAIDTIIDGVQTVTMNRPGTRAAPVREYVSEAPAVDAPATVAPAATASSAEALQVAMVAPSQPTPAAAEAVQVVEPAATAEVPILDTDARPEDLMPPFSVTDPVVVGKVQRGLASLGFLHGPADGVAGEATAKAIRNFEVYFNYKVTGRISPELLDLLARNGASI